MILPVYVNSIEPFREGDRLYLGEAGMATAIKTDRFLGKAIEASFSLDEHGYTTKILFEVLGDIITVQDAARLLQDKYPGYEIELNMKKPEDKVSGEGIEPSTHAGKEPGAPALDAARSES